MNFDITVGVNQLSVSTNFTKRGETLIFFIHGLGCSKDSFKDVWERDEFKDFSLMSCDLPGFGDSNIPEGFQVTMEIYAEVCKELINKSGCKNVHIVAHSMGGAVGLILSKMIPGKLLSFVNAEGNLTEADTTLLSGRIVKFSREAFKRVAFNMITSSVNESGTKSEKEWASQCRKADPDAMYDSASSLIKWSNSGVLLEMFNSLTVPSFFIYGENSGCKTLDLIKGSEIIMMENTGHFMMIDDPEKFYSLIHPKKQRKEYQSGCNGKKS